MGIDLPVRELRRRTTMRGERPGFLRFLSKFEIYRGLYPSRPWIERVAFEAAEDARKDGVVYLELRFSPAHFGRRMKARGEDVAAWVARGARRAGIEVGFIATFGRDFSLKQNEPTTRAVQGTDLFCGLDIAGDESKSALPFLKVFKRLDLPVTIHAGEAQGADSVREAIAVFGARRIGHGVRLLEDPGLVDLARRQGTTFELCLTSEVQTGAAASWRLHPARRMLSASLAVTINTDDPSIVGVQLSDEYRSAEKAGFSPRDLALAARRAVQASFRARSVKSDLRARVDRAWPIDTPGARGLKSRCK